MIMGRLDNIIDKFNSGYFDTATSFFGDFESFFDYLGKKKVLDRIDPKIGEYEDFVYEEYQKDLLLKLAEYDVETLYKFVESSFPDVKIEDGIPYIYLTNLYDLSYYFCDNKQALRTLQFKSYGLDYSPGIYEIISYLNVSNTNRLKKEIINSFEGIEIYPETPVLYELADDADSDHVKIDESNISYIIDDPETIKYLFREYKNDIKSRLRDLYLSAQDSSFSDSAYQELFNTLESLFIGGIIETGDVKYPYKMRIFEFREKLYDYISRSRNDYPPLENFSSFGDMIYNFTSCLLLNHSRIENRAMNQLDERINELFSEFF